MAKSTMDFAQQNTERAVQATNWVLAIAEQNLNQSKAALEGLLTIARNAVRSIDRQSSAICEHSIAAGEQTLSNAFDFAHKVIRIKEPQELVQIQSDVVSRQAQVLGEQNQGARAKDDGGSTRDRKGDRDRNGRISKAIRGCMSRMRLTAHEQAFELLVM